MSDTTPPFLPFARPDIGEAEIAAVTQALRSGWVTTGPNREFEQTLPTTSVATACSPSPSTRPLRACTWPWRPWVSARATK